MFKAESDVRPAGSGASRGQLSGAPAKGEIGFVGLGHMGMAMALNLIAGGHRVIGYVRRRDQISRLVALGLNVATDIGEFVAWRLCKCCRRPAIYSNEIGADALSYCLTNKIATFGYARCVGGCCQCRWIRRPCRRRSATHGP
jgi:hypothetical protein